MNGIRRLASLPVAAVAILALLAVALKFAPPLTGVGKGGYGGA